MKDEDLDTLSRELRVNAATLSARRKAFWQSGMARLKGRKVARSMTETRRSREKALGEAAFAGIRASTVCYV